MKCPALLQVHAGFYRSWTSVRETVLRTVDACTGGQEDWHVYVTGHSLGGALAILCSWELAQRERCELVPIIPSTFLTSEGTDLSVVLSPAKMACLCLVCGAVRNPSIPSQCTTMEARALATKPSWTCMT